MNHTLIWGRWLFALAMVGTGIQQLCMSTFANMIFPPWPATFKGYWIFSGLVSLCLIVAGMAALLRRHDKDAMLLLGGLLLLLMLGGQVPFEYAVIPHSKTHLGVWVFPLKELALAGGAFVLATAHPASPAPPRTGLLQFLAQIAVAGPYLFATTMILFGWAHIIYVNGTIPLVPHFFPAPTFWVYLTGIALMAAGISIVLRLADQVAALLLGCMIFSWIFLVHLPNLFRQPAGHRTDQVTATLSALAFSGTAFVISGLAKKRKLHSAAKNAGRPAVLQQTPTAL